MCCFHHDSVTVGSPSPGSGTRLLRPHHANVARRLVKTPKLHLLDPGLLCYLREIGRPEDRSIHPARGAVFESWVVSEVLKSGQNLGGNLPLYFWRDHAGHEIDLLVGAPPQAVPIEAKSGATLTREAFRGLAYWRTLVGGGSAAGWLVHGGEETQERAEGRAVSWREIDRCLQDLRPAAPGDPAAGGPERGSGRRRSPQGVPPRRTIG